MIRDRMLRRYFPIFERLGIHAVPRHWFEPIPDRETLTSDVFERRSALVGIDLRIDAQLEMLRAFAHRYGDEYGRFPDTAGEAPPGGYFLHNGTFESIDAEILYSMVRWSHPRKLVEVGLGYSSVLIDQALKRNERETGIRCHHVGIDPWPEPIVDGIADMEILRQRVEQTPVDLFTSLQAGDVLFIDSTHVLRTGGDVAFEYLEVLPRLAPGVVVHVHDIFLPGEYPRHWLVDLLWFPTEQYVLQAFLTHNDAYEVLWSSAAVAASHPAELSEAIPSRVTGLGPGSFWIRRKGHEAPALPEDAPL
ncbi:MAG TPA: class I SAM-dependent methyltransferase [Acidimicrobiales bacterium]|nr:class I SAM-dependent methyltransferase [Acidimicrobiales bacterium]